MVVQGDVFFTKVKVMPDSAKSVERTVKGFVIAEGEVTGHAHVVADNIELYEMGGVLYLRTEREVQVRHEEHKSVSLSKGIWKVGIVREYDPFEEEARKVRD